MFCPKCGIETPEGHRFCKACGTNLQLVSDALAGAEDTLGQLRVDLDGLKRGFAEIGKKIKADIMSAADGSFRSTRRLKDSRQTASSLGRPLRPKEWLSYSWQHNLRDGLISLFTGAGMGFLLYYVGQAAIDAGTIGSIESQIHAQGLEQLVRLAWLLAAIPVLKGIAQIIYSAFFAESIATLTGRFLPPQLPVQQEPEFRAYQAAAEPPASVTEQTTNIFEKEQPAG